MLGTPERPARRRRAARRADADAGRARSPASWASTWSPARSPSASRAREKRATPRVHIGPDGEDRAVYRKIHMFDVEVGGRVYRESDAEEPGDEIVVSRPPDGVELGHDHLLRPALPRALPHARRRAARASSPSPPRSRSPTTRDHWEVLLRARAIEDQAFVVAANQVGAHAPGLRSGGRSMIVDPWGVVLAQAPDARARRRRRPRPRRARRGSAASCRRSPTGARRSTRWPADGATPQRQRRPPPTSAARSSTPPCACSPARASTPAACRTSPTRRASPTASSTTTSSPRTRCSTRCSSSAGTSCSRRSREVDRQRRAAPRDKLARDRGVHRRLLPPRPRADEGDHRRGDAGGELVRRRRTSGRSARPTRRSPTIVAKAQADGEFRADVDRRVRCDGVLRRDRAGAHRLDLRAAAAARGRLRARPSGSSSRRSAAASTRPSPQR